MAIDPKDSLYYDTVIALELDVKIIDDAKVRTLATTLATVVNEDGSESPAIFQPTDRYGMAAKVLSDLVKATGFAAAMEQAGLKLVMWDASGSRNPHLPPE